MSTSIASALPAESPRGFASIFAYCKAMCGGLHKPGRAALFAALALPAGCKLSEPASPTLGSDEFARLVVWRNPLARSTVAPLVSDNTVYSKPGCKASQQLRDKTAMEGGVRSRHQAVSWAHPLADSLFCPALLVP